MRLFEHTPVGASLGARFRATLGWLLLTTLTSGCQPAPWLVVAQRGSLPELKKSVDQGRQQGKFDRKAIEKLARLILEREIRSATDPEGEPLIEQLTDCAIAVEPALVQRSKRQDETAGMAEYALVASGRELAETEWRHAARAESSARRAAAALDTSEPQRFEMRERLLNDPDERVRRAALKSCTVAPSMRHWETLGAILRRDPDPTCRQLAAKVIGVMGGSDAVTCLSDAWPRADQALRLAIVSGWAQAATFTAGGRDYLVAKARSEPGQVGVLAAADLVRGDSNARWQGRARITRALQFGSTEDRPLAVMAADWSDPEQARLLFQLGLAAEPETRVLALERWLEKPEHRWPATTWLHTMAEGEDTPALSARAALAQYGDHSVVAALRTQLGYAKAATRIHAARHLWLLDDLNGMATALTDDAPLVRAAAACMILGDPKPR